jgi:hypothetical protein
MTEIHQHPGGGQANERVVLDQQHAQVARLLLPGRLRLAPMRRCRRDALGADPALLALTRAVSSRAEKGLLR